jgi:hypothetical protein
MLPGGPPDQETAFEEARPDTLLNWIPTLFLLPEFLKVAGAKQISSTMHTHAAFLLCLLAGMLVS